jgi:hypothetical protein
MTKVGHEKGCEWGKCPHIQIDFHKCGMVQGNEP